MGRGIKFLTVFKSVYGWVKLELWIECTHKWFLHFVVKFCLWAYGAHYTCCCRHCFDVVVVKCHLWLGATSGWVQPLAECHIRSWVEMQIPCINPCLLAPSIPILFDKGVYICSRGFRGRVINYSSNYIVCMAGRVKQELSLELWLGFGGKGFNF